MLRDIDLRSSEPGAAGAMETPKPVGEAAPRRSAFWTVVALALVLALGTAAWSFWRMKPSKLMSDVAFQQAAEAQKRAAPAPSPNPPAAPKPAPAPASEALAEAPKPVPEPAEATPKPQASAQPKAPRRAAERRKITAPSDAELVQAVALLNKGRVSEAEDELARIVQADPTQAQARQAYVALLLEQGRIDAARQVLVETLERDPAQPIFALALARLYAEQRDFGAALQVMDRAGTQSGDFDALRGAIYQRMGRHAEAVSAYRSALAAGGQSPQTWIGLAISLEALRRRAEAAEAYRRGIAAGELPRQVREYAEARVRALD